MYPTSSEAKEEELDIVKDTLHNNKYNMNKIIKTPDPTKTKAKY
jgi:hypothetical protein